MYPKWMRTEDIDLDGVLFPPVISRFQRFGFADETDE